ncbi:MAG: potassium transporter TrkG, partial [Phycisphaeraceae bacterium]
MPMDEVEPAGRFVLMTLMMVGGSPGGTAGGMKTTTVALLVLTIAATVRRRQHTEAFKRRISDPLVRRAATIGACFVALVCVAIGLLSLSEPVPFGDVAFEAISGATTTGLSTGITGELTGFGKVVMIGTMFLGRVGPLALLGALLFGSRPARPYDYPHEDVVMG